PEHDDTRRNMVPQEPLLCRHLFCFTAIAIVLPTQRAQLNPITPLSCMTHTEPYPDFSLLCSSLALHAASPPLRKIPPYPPFIKGGMGRCSQARPLGKKSTEQY